MDDKDAAQRVTEIRDDVITFALQQLSTENQRDKYKALLELTVIFLGGIPPKGIKFRCPEAFHRARWMARAIYAIKMRLFMDQFPIQQRQSSERASRKSLLSKGVESFTSSDPFCDNNLREVLVHLYVTC